MEPDSLNAEGLYQHESVERSAFTDCLRLNRIDPVPDKAERESIKVLEMEPDLLDTEDGRQHDASVTQASCKLNGELNGIKLELRIGEPIQSMSTDLFRYKGALAVKGKPDKLAFQDVRMPLAVASATRCWSLTSHPLHAARRHACCQGLRLLAEKRPQGAPLRIGRLGAAGVLGEDRRRRS